MKRFLNLFFLLFFILALKPINSMAQNGNITFSLSSNNFSFDSNQQEQSFSLNINNSAGTEFIALQTTLTLPDNLVLSGCQLGSALSNTGFTISPTYDGNGNETGEIKILLMNLTNLQPSNIKSGEIAKLTLKAKTTVSETGKFQFSDFLYTTKNFQEIKLNQTLDATYSIITEKDKDSMTFSMSPDNFNIKQGATQEISLNISNPNKLAFIALQTDLNLPDGLILTGCQVGSALEKSGFTISPDYNGTGNETGKISITLMNYTFTSSDITSGEIVKLTVKAADDAKTGNGKITFSNFIYTSTGLQQINLSSTAEGNVTIEEDVIEATKVTISATDLKMMVGQTGKLTATVEPSDVTNPTVTWSSDTPTVATVGDDGTVTAVSKGSAIITATCGNVSATCTVTVYNKNDVIPGPGENTTNGDVSKTPEENTENGGSLIGSDLTLRVGQTAGIKLGLPEGLTNVPNLQWTLGNGGNTFVTMVPNGISANFTGKAKGTTTYTVSLAGSSEILASGNITVIDNIINVSNITISPATATVEAGKTVTLTATVTPDDATDKSVNWSTSDATVATVANGVVTGVKKGEVTITATASNGKSATAKVTVTAPQPTGITLNLKDMVLKVGETAQLTPTLTPADAETTFSWSSSAQNIASVSNTGLVTAIAEGTTTITVKTSNGLTASCNVRVEKDVIEVSNITVSPATATVEAGKTVTLTATVTPADATDKSVNWSTSDANTATVANGVVTGVKKGEVTITATVSNGKSATAKVTVTAPQPTGMILNLKDMVLKVGETGQLTPTLTPADAETTFTWSSSAANIASVSNTGLVTAIAEGTTTITVTTSNNLTATCNVRVEKDVIEVSNITVSPATATVEAGKTVTLTATVTPDEVTDKSVNWTTSDANTATVANGVVTGVRKGEVTITATASNGKSATAKVTVTAPQPTEITLNLKDMVLKVGETGQLTPTLTPDDAETTFTWSSSAQNIASVSNTGLVTAIAEGTTTITVKTSNNLTATCNVRVEKNVIEVSNITVSPATAMVEAGKTVTLTATVTPADATDKSVNWSTSDANTATVANGVVTGVKKGEVTITATASNGKSATAKVTVTAPQPTEVSLNLKDMVLKVGETAQLTPTLTPADAETTFTWSSSAANIASVSNTGLVAAIAEGTTTITVQTSNGLTATCNVRVEKDVIEVSTITVSPATATVEAGNTVTLTATVTPAEATDKSVNWSTSDATVATVDANGVVTGVKKGEVTITATASNGKSATAKVTVTAPQPTGMTLNLKDMVLKVGETGQLIPTLTPADAETTFTWSSSAANIASVSNTGLVTAIAEGTTTITVKTSNNLTATCNVRVEKDVIEVSNITVSPATATVEAGKTVTLTATVTPTDATDKSVNWTTSDATVATVDANGVVTGVKKGVVTITATASNGKSATAKVTVTAPQPTGMTLNLKDMVLKVGETGQLIPTLTPADAETTFTWSSSAANIASVSNTGLVTAIAEGTTTITVKTSNGLTASCNVRVEKDVIEATNINLSLNDIKMLVGQTEMITATVEPANTTYPTVTWTSASLEIATIEPDGTISAISKGVTTVTATCGNVSANCTVTVYDIKDVTTKPGDGTTNGNPDNSDEENTENGGSLIGSDLILRVGQTAGIVLGLPEGLTNVPDLQWSLANGGEAYVGMAANGISANFTGKAKGQTTYNVTVAGSSEVIASGKITVINDIPDIPEGPKWEEPKYPGEEGDEGLGNNDGTTEDEDGWYERNGIHVSTLKTREGNTVGMWTEKPTGGYNNEWEFNWTVLGEEIGFGQEIEYIASMSSGDSKEISSQTPLVTMSNYGPQDELLYEASFYGPTVDVYRRPLTPLQMVRKGDGTSHVFIVMMPLSNSQLTNLEYRYVYGYTDANGNENIIDITDLRYCRASEEVYDDPSNTFWAYSVWSYSDGSVISSGLRYLDGGADEDFDASTFDGSGLTRLPNQGNNVTAIYSLDGHYMGEDTSRLAPGIYIRHEIFNGVSNSQKIVVR